MTVSVLVLSEKWLLLTDRYLKKYNSCQTVSVLYLKECFTNEITVSVMLSIQLLAFHYKLLSHSSMSDRPYTAPQYRVMRVRKPGSARDIFSRHSSVHRAS